MKRKLLLGMFIWITPLIIHAQNDYHNLFELGIGLTKYKTKELKFEEPYLAFTYEHRIMNVVGIGVFLAEGEFDGYNQYGYFATKETGTFSVLGLRLDFFFLNRNRFDLYGGVQGGLTALPSNLYYGAYGEPVSNANGLKVAGQVGAHYWVRQHFGFWAEVNVGPTYAISALHLIINQSS